MSVCFSPESTRVLTWIDHYLPHDKAQMAFRAGLWEAATGVPVASLKHDDTIFCATFSPDGQRVVTGSRDCTARIWDATTGASIGQALGHEDWVKAAAFSPDGTRVVTASHDGTARIWNAATGAPISQPLVHEGEVNSATFSPDGTHVLTASRDCTARIWDAVTGMQIGEPMQHGHKHGEGFWAYVESAHFSPDGRRVLTELYMPWAESTEMQVWDASTRQPIGPRLSNHYSVRP